MTKGNTCLTAHKKINPFLSFMQTDLVDCVMTSPMLLLAVASSPMSASSVCLLVLHLSMFSVVFQPVFFQLASHSLPSLVTSPHSFLLHAQSPFQSSALHKSYNIGELLMKYKVLINSIMTFWMSYMLWKNYLLQRLITDSRC